MYNKLNENIIKATARVVLNEDINKTILFNDVEDYLYDTEYSNRWDKIENDAKKFNLKLNKIKGDGKIGTEISFSFTGSTNNLNKFLSYYELGKLDDKFNGYGEEKSYTII